MDMADTRVRGKIKVRFWTIFRARALRAVRHVVANGSALPTRRARVSRVTFVLRKFHYGSLMK